MLDSRSEPADLRCQKADHVAAGGRCLQPDGKSVQGTNIPIRYNKI